VAAGSVVTKSCSEPGCILGGNPAKVIGGVDNYLERSQSNFLSLQGKSFQEKKDIILGSEKLIES